MPTKTFTAVRNSPFNLNPKNWHNLLHIIEPNTDAVFGDETGYCYSRANGEYLGIIGKPSDNVLIGKAKKVTNNKDGTVTTRVTNISTLSINHPEFKERAATIYGESTAYKSNDTLELIQEMTAIAFVHKTNKEAYGDTSEPAVRFRGTLLHKQTEKMQLANWAIIHSVISGGFDYSNDATMWDGAEQSEFPASEMRGSIPRKKGLSWELHMNTMGWKITDAHYAKWKKNVGSRFKAPQIRVSPANYKKYTNKGKIRLFSRAVYGQTIFWEEI